MKTVSGSQIAPYANLERIVRGEEKGSVLTIDTGSWFALKLGGAAPAANSIRGSYLSSDEPG